MLQSTPLRPSRAGLARLGVCAALLAAVALAHAGTASAGGRLCGVAKHHPRVYDHVVVVVMENKSYGDVMGSRSAPYLNNLARACGSATSYRALTHPSLPNYIGMVSGTTSRFEGTDCSPSSRCSASRRTIFSQVRRWSVFAESMPAPCARENHGNYAVRHNPAVYFRGLRGCRANDLPFTRFRLRGRFVLVVPNLCSDMHDCSVGHGDAWLKRFIPRVTKTRSYRRGRTALFVTWDEADGSSANQVPMLVLSRSTPRGRHVRVPFDHYSALKTWQKMLGRGCLARSCGARSMRGAFHL